MSTIRALLVATLFTMLVGPASAQWQVFRLEEGQVVLHLEPELLADLGLEIVDLHETAAGVDPLLTSTEPPYISFAVDASSDLLFLVGHNGGFVPYGVLGGTVQTIGGFGLRSVTTGRAVDFENFIVHPQEVRNDGPAGEPDPDYFHLSQAGTERGGDFLLCYVKIAFDPEGQGGYGGVGPGDHVKPVVRIKAWDLVVSDLLAQKLDRPDLAKRTIGSGAIEATATVWDGEWSYPDGQNPWTPYTGGDPAGTGPGDGSTLDVKLGILSSITQLGHTGTFPNGRAGLSMATTSCNVGDEQVDWLAPMAEEHPGITQSLYRMQGNRFEQVGTAWVKHGFFALANSQCTPCQGGSPQGKFLGIGCSDTYGTNNNGNRTYLGPRDEWNPHTASWEACGSFFDGVPVDCQRDENGSGFGPVDHRLEAFDYDLGLSGATYFYESNYLVAGDTNKINNIGSRECTMNWTGSAWSFSTPSAGSGNPLIEGPAIDRYGDMRTVVSLAPDDGRVVLAVKTEDLGGGLWRYEYALFNWDLDRKVRSFTVPNCGNATDFYFHDIDDQAANDWMPTTSAGNLTWTFPDVFLGGHKVAGPLGFATLYNFGFTSNAAPGTRNAVLGLHDAGAGGDLHGAATLAPACLNLSSTAMSPETGVSFDIDLTGGSGQAMLAVMEIAGVPLSSAILIGPFPFVGNEASLTAVVPPSATGIDFVLLGAEVTLAPLTLVDLSNSLRLKVQ
ncbi:MAG: hypothetical protein ACYTG2_11160 [Planctomycetota bacterium]|jgi:hypothetical protein